MTVPAVSEILEWQARHRNTTVLRWAKRYGSPTFPHLKHVKTIRPPQVLKVSCACWIIGEYPLEFRERRRKTTGIHGRNLASECLIGNKPDRQAFFFMMLLSFHAAERRDGEAGAAHVGGAKLAVARLLGEFAHFHADLQHALLVGVLDDRNDQTVGCVGCETDVEVLLVNQRNGSPYAKALVSRCARQMRAPHPPTLPSPAG